jgi:hypothetical protein
MSRPTVEVADIFRSAASRFLRRHRASFQQLKVIRAIVRCRTAALGGHIDTCTGCGKQWGLSYNSCRDRHCPKCQAQTRRRWLAARQNELLPVPYFHVVFTLPHKLNTLIRANPKTLYNLLFRSVADTLSEVARNRKRIGGEIGFLAILHTWTQTLLFHPHIHCVVPGGGLNPDHTRWIPAPERFFLPRRVLRSVFRGKFIHGLRSLHASGTLRFPTRLRALENPKRFRSWTRSLHIHEWVVYLKPPFGGPEQVLRYLGRYTHRVAISNHRLVSFDGNRVQFRWRDRKSGNQRTMELSADEFIRRFLLHVLGKGFVRIRHFGFMANHCRQASLALCRQLLDHLPSARNDTPVATADGRTCPDCGAPLKVTERLTATEILFRRELRLCPAFDTS